MFSEFTIQITQTHVRFDFRSMELREGEVVWFKLMDWGVWWPAMIKEIKKKMLYLVWFNEPGR